MLFILLITIGSAKIYARAVIKENLNKTESTNLISTEKWKTLFLICSDTGLAEFKYGRVLYKTFNKKEEGLQVMDRAASKNIKPNNIRYLAYRNLELKNYDRAQELFELNTFTEPFKYKPKIDYLKFLIKSKQTKKACKYAKEIINFPVKVQSKKINNYKKSLKKFTENNNCE